MTMRYVHPAEDHKREAVAKLENFNAMEAAKLAQTKQFGGYKLGYTRASN